MTHHQAKASYWLFLALVFPAHTFAQQAVPSSINSLFTRGENQVVPSTKVFAPRAKRVAGFFGDGINAPVSELKFDELPEVRRAEFVSPDPATKSTLQAKPNKLPQATTNPVPTTTTTTPIAAPTATSGGSVGCFSGDGCCSSCGGTGSGCSCGGQVSGPRRRLFTAGLQNDVPCKYGRPALGGRIGEMTRRFRERRLLARRGRIEQRLANLGSQCPRCGIGASSCAGRFVGAGVGAVGYGMHSFGCGFSRGVQRYDHCYDTCGCDKCGCGGNRDRGSYGRGIVASCKAIRDGVGRPYGDMPGHYPYDTCRNYYYYRPYNSVHYRDQQDCSGSMGFGTPSQPYTGDALERAYEETLQETMREDKRYLEYSSSGGETLFNGNERYEEPGSNETFFPESNPIDIEWEPGTESYSTEEYPAETFPTEIPLPAMPASEDSRPYGIESAPSPPTVSDPFEQPIAIPDEPTDPASISAPLFDSEAPAATNTSVNDDKAIENLIDKLLPIEDPSISQP